MPHDKTVGQMSWRSVQKMLAIQKTRLQGKEQRGKGRKWPEGREGSGPSQVPEAEEKERGGGIRNSVSGQDRVQDGRIQSAGCKEGGQEMGLRD